MAKKKLKTDGIFFSGKNAEDVTGSQAFIRFGDSQILLECGLHQSRSNSYLDSYKINSEKFKFKPSEIDFVFINHAHIDHCGLIPRLVKEGFRGKIITTRNTALIMKPLLFNSCAIIQDEARVLSKRFGRNYVPLYEEDDVRRALSLIEVHDQYNYLYHLSDTVSFKWMKNSHCVGAAQLHLELSYGSKKRKVLYTSDIGALNTKNHYLVNTEIPADFYDVAIQESTYGLSSREAKKPRAFDVEHLRTAINTVLERKGTVILPCFSFSRTQEMLTVLYELYGNDAAFNYRVIIDSMLSCEICNLYDSLLDGSDLQKWNDVSTWKNVQFISEKDDSRAAISDRSPKIVVSSSGFCTNGRVVNWLKQYLPDKNSMIIFSGYAGDNKTYLSYRIKNFREHKTISINKEKIANHADCITLSTFSSHANHSDLVKFGSSLNTNKLILVHGSDEGKNCLAEKLREAISKNNKSYRVICSTKDLVVHL